MYVKQREVGLKKLLLMNANVDWQVFSNTENEEKSRKLSTKRKIAENIVFATQNKKI